MSFRQIALKTLQFSLILFICLTLIGIIPNFLKETKNGIYTNARSYMVLAAFTDRQYAIPAAQMLGQSHPISIFFDDFKNVVYKQGAILFPGTEGERHVWASERLNDEYVLIKRPYLFEIIEGRGKHYEKNVLPALEKSLNQIFSVCLSLDEKGFKDKKKKTQYAFLFLGMGNLYTTDSEIIWNYQHKNSSNLKDLVDVQKFPRYNYLYKKIDKVLQDFRKSDLESYMTYKLSPSYDLVFLLKHQLLSQILAYRWFYPKEAFCKNIEEINEFKKTQNILTSYVRNPLHKQSSYTQVMDSALKTPLALKVNTAVSTCQ